MYSNQQSIYLDAWNLSSTMSYRKQYISFWFWPRINPPYIVHTNFLLPQIILGQLTLGRVFKILEWHSHVRITSVVYIMSSILYPKIENSIQLFLVHPKPLPQTYDGTRKLMILVNSGPFPEVLCLFFVAIISKWKMGQNVGVSKNSGTPKWMVYNGKPY